MAGPTPDPFQPAFVGAGAVSFVVFLAVALSLSEPPDAHGWGYIIGSFAFPTILGGLLAGWWTRSSKKNLSFFRTALRGGVIAFVVIAITAVGRMTEADQTRAETRQAIATWKQAPMPIAADWPQGWKLQPVRFDDKLNALVQAADFETKDRYSTITLMCRYLSPAARARFDFDGFLRGTAEGVAEAFKKNDAEVKFGAFGDGKLGA